MLRIDSVSVFKKCASLCGSPHGVLRATNRVYVYPITSVLLSVYLGILKFTVLVYLREHNTSTRFY